MVAGVWKVYDTTRKKLGDGTLDLAGGIFYLTLHTPASNAATITLSSKGSLDNEITSGNGYSNSAMTLSLTSWTSVAASTYRFDACDWFVSANGGTVPPSGSDIQFGVIFQSGGALVCYSTLSTVAFNITTTNRLTVQLHASGVFQLTGG